MRELNADEKIAGRPVLAAWHRDELLERGQRVLRNQQLPGISARIRIDGNGFAPEQCRSPGAESFPATERQLVWRALERAVTPFHRMDREPVSNCPMRNRKRLERRLNVVLESDVNAERGDLFLERAPVGE